MTPAKIFYTGRPGVGKSTIVRRVKELIEDMGCRVGGIIAPEVRGSDGKRIGFKIVDIMSGEEGWLAKVGYPGPRLGKYGIVTSDVLRIGVGALEKAKGDADVIVIDEIGPMELLVPQLRSTIIAVLKLNKPTIGVIHRRLRSRDPYIYRIIEQSSQIIEVTLENRERLLEGAGEIAAKLCGKGSNQGR